MARRAKSGPTSVKDRLTLIKQRHRELILQPRKNVAESVDDEFEDSFDEAFDPEELELVEAGIDIGAF
jgi:hypothetical protein